MRGRDRGELVGGLGEVVRSPAEIGDVLATLSKRTDHADEGSDYRDDVAATLR